MKNTSNNMNRKSVLALTGTLSLAIASSANGQAAGNDIGSFVGGYSSAAQKIQTVSGTVQTGNRMNQAGRQALPEFSEPLGTDSCGSETLTQSTNEAFIDSNSVWCGSLDNNAETSLARGFIAPADLTLKCVTFGIRENIGGAANVNVRVLVGSPSSLYADLTLVSETVVSIADNTAFALFTAELGEVQIPAGSQFIVELNTPSRVPGLGGDGGLLSFGTNTLGQSGSTYLRGPECALNDFVDVANLGFGNRHLVMSLGFDNGIAPTIQGGFPMSAIGDAVMSQLGDELVIAGDPNGSEFGAAIDFGTATSGVGATLSLFEDDGAGGGTLAVSFMGETEVNTIQLSDYQGDSDVAVLELDFDDSSFDTFDVEVYENGVLVGILYDQSSGTVLIRSTLEDGGRGWRRFVRGVRWLWNHRDEIAAFVDRFRGINVEGEDGESFDGDGFRIVAGSASPFNESMTSMEFAVSGLSGFTVNLGEGSPTVAIGDALSAPYYGEFGEIVATQVGVSFSLYGTGSSAILTGEDVDGDGLAELIVDSPSGSFAVDMALDGVESASIAFDTVSGIWPPYPIEFCPFGPPINDGPGGCTPGPDGCFPDPFGKFGTGPYNPLPSDPILWTVNPDFTGMDYDSVAYEFFLDGVSVATISDAEGLMGWTSEMVTRAGVFSGDDYGFEAYYPAGTMFTTNDGTVFEVDEIQMIAVGAIGPDSLSFMRIAADITDEDATDVMVSFSLPETVLTDFNLCPADLSGDGMLNFFDISAFLIAYSSQDPAADFTNDGLFNFFDVSAFLSAFAVGCP